MAEDNLRLRCVPPGPARDPVRPLLLLADDAAAVVARRRDDGELFVAAVDGRDIGAVQVVGHGDGQVELWLVAVAEGHQGRGHGRAMLAAVCEQLAARGISRVLVGTSNASIGQLAFYQKVGFRMLRIERDHFDAARGYDGTERENGLPIRDLVWFDRTL